jgi:DNA-binding PadR family transcriptional regulator
MNTRDLWENQVELLTKHCQTLTRQIDEMEQRMEYYEGVVYTLLVALKESGVIKTDVESDETTYEF